jgi:hypothetical protein
LHRKEVYGVLAFWVAIVDTMGFVSQTASQVSVCEGLRFAKMVGDLNIFLMRFFYLLYYGDNTRGTRRRSQLQK